MRRACILACVGGCGPEVGVVPLDTDGTSSSESGATVESTSESPGSTSLLESSGGDTTGGALDGTSETGEPQPTVPECPDGFRCGDGVVDPGEGCDDANADDTDGCTRDCRRPAPTVFAPLEFDSFDVGAAVDEDGSILVAGGSPPELVRLAPEGLVWSVPMELPAGVSAVRVQTVLIGAQIVVVGNDLDELGGVAWRFEPDGSFISVVSGVPGSGYGGAGLASDGGLVVMTSDRNGQGVVERQAPDGGVMWSRAIDPDGTIGGTAVAVASDTSVFVAGGIGGLGDMAITRVTPDASTSLVLSPPEFPNAYLDRIAALPDGGAVAVGDASGYGVVVRVDAAGELVWFSDCAAPGARTESILVAEDRILLGGRRNNPDCGFVSCRGGEAWLWIQHLSLEGTVLANDAANASLVARDVASESVLALGRHSDGTVSALGGVTGSGSLEELFVAQFPW